MYLEMVVIGTIIYLLFLAKKEVDPNLKTTYWIHPFSLFLFSDHSKNLDPTLKTDDVIEKSYAIICVGLVLHWLQLLEADFGTE